MGRAYREITYIAATCDGCQVGFEGDWSEWEASQWVQLYSPVDPNEELDFHNIACARENIAKYVTDGGAR